MMMLHCVYIILIQTYLHYHNINIPDNGGSDWVHVLSQLFMLILREDNKIIDNCYIIIKIK